MRIFSVSPLLMLFLAVAGTERSAASDLFRDLDQDSDGRIEAAEVPEARIAHFRRALRVADRDRDGVLVAEELTAAVTDPEPMTPPASKLAEKVRKMDPAKLDQDQDGEITLQEIPEPLRPRFQEILDRAGKKSVSVEQLREYLAANGLGPRNDGEPKKKQKSEGAAKKRAESAEEMKSEDKGQEPKQETEKSERPGKRAADNRSKGPGNRKKPENGEPSPEARFQRMDKNQDGQLSSDEIPERLKSRLDKIDANADGSVSREEFLQAGARLKSRQQ